MTISIAFIVEILLLGLAIALAAYFLPFVRVRNYGTAIIVGILIAVVNNVAAWVLAQLGIYVNINSITIVSFLLNIFAIMLVDKFVRGFRVSGFWMATLFALLVIFIHFALRYVLSALF